MTNPTSFDQQVVFLPTADLERADRFYQGQLGLKLVLNQGVCRIYRTGPHAYLGVCEHLAEGAGDPRVIVTLVADDVDGWYERLTEAGVVFEAPPARNDRFGIYHAFMRDPDGNLLEIQRFEDAAWPRI